MNKMSKKLISIMIMALIVCTAVCADTTYFSVGAPKGGETSEIDIAFSYDPETMQRLTFGFTEDTSIDWFGPNGDLNNKGLNLGTQVMQGRGELARGKGKVNFYWVLRTNKAVTAKLYLAAPMTEVKSADPLDWSIRFDSQVDGAINSGKFIDSLYGIANAEPIFTRTASFAQDVMMGYQPVEVYTDFAPVKIENQSYVGTVGVLVETN